MDQFPLKRFNYTDEDIHKMFNKLKNYKHDSTRFETKEYNTFFKNLDNKFKLTNTPYLITSKATDYLDWNILSDMFQEEVRLKGCVDSNPSPYDFFYNNIDLVKQTALDKYKEINNHTLREALWGLTKECTTFRPNVLMSIIQIFNSKSVLDFSAGWGDRLLACIASDVSYIGVDPNLELHKGYHDMIQMFAPGNESKYILIPDSIEHANLDNINNLDLVFTSPPYFNYEIYDKEDKTGKQSSKYTNEQDWFNKFLKVALQKCWNKLNSKGIFAINISQGKNNKYVYWMHSYMKTLDSEYLGVISYINENRRASQPIWIWKKN